MRKNILTEKSNPRSRNIDLMNTSEIIHCINKEDQKVARAVAKAQAEITKAVDCMTDCILNDGRVAYFGAGTSGRLGVLDAAELLPTYSLPPHIIQGFIAGGDSALRRSAEHAEDNQEFAIKDLNSFNPTSKDVVIGISASGNPAYVLTILQEAQKRGARTIGITCNPQAKLKEFSDICITVVVGPEVITGSSRMKAGTAQKMILNILSTATMIKTGKTYGNYMIDVTPTCNKLIDRSNRIISSICKISIAKADEYRIKANNKIKIACVMYIKQCTKEEAELILKQHNGILRKVI